MTPDVRPAEGDERGSAASLGPVDGERLARDNGIGFELGVNSFIRKPVTEIVELPRDA